MSSGLKKHEIDQVFKLGQNLKTKFLHFYGLKKSTHHGKICVIIRRSICRKAVDRNYCKRVQKVLFQQYQRQSQYTCVVVVVQKQWQGLQAKDRFTHSQRAWQQWSKEV